MTSIREATLDDLDSASRVLAEAFENYPWTRWAIPEDDFLRRLKELQRLYLGYALDEGLVLIDEHLNGVIALLPPKPLAPSQEFQRSVAELHGDRFEVVANVNLPPVPEGCWTLETVGMLPQRQGMGLGVQLIRTALGVVEARYGSAVALKTSAASNVRLYERVGFAVTGTTQIDQGPIVHSMLINNETDLATRQAETRSSLTKMLGWEGPVT